MRWHRQDGSPVEGEGLWNVHWHAIYRNYTNVTMNVEIAKRSKVRVEQHQVYRRYLSIVVVFFWQKKVRGEIFFLLIFYECDSGTSLISWRWSYVPCHSPCASFFQCKHICVVCAHAYVIIHLISSPFPPFSFISLPCWHCTWYTRQWPLEISLLQTTTCQEFPDKWGLGKVYMI